jgi:hypothetical protein
MSLDVHSKLRTQKGETKMKTIKGNAVKMYQENLIETVSETLQNVYDNCLTVGEGFQIIKTSFAFNGVLPFETLQDVSYTHAYKGKILTAYPVKANRLQWGNKKLSKQIGIFSLPAVETCPNCLDCKANCYALKAQKQYPGSRVFRLVNWVLAEFYPAELKKQITVEIQKKRNKKAIRIHESGDFYSRKYLELWLEIARENPTVKFYGYTKVNAYLDILNSQENVNFVASVLPSGEVNFGDLQWVKKTSKAMSIPVCPVTLGVKKAICGETCSLCQRKTRVLFVQH